MCAITDTAPANSTSRIVLEPSSTNTTSTSPARHPTALDEVDDDVELEDVLPVEDVDVVLVVVVVEVDGDGDGDVESEDDGGTIEDLTKLVTLELTEPVVILVNVVDVSVGERREENELVEGVVVVVVVVVELVDDCSQNNGVTNP
jgi:hypothetical protein